MNKEFCSFLIWNFARIESNMELLFHCASSVSGGEIITLNTTKSNYINAVNFLNKKNHFVNNKNEDIIIEVEDSIESSQEITNNILLALERIADNCLLANIVYRLIAVIKASDKKHLFNSGSISNNLGTIVICPSEEWSEIDYIETIVHEATHQAVFLEDMINKIFNNYDEINDKNHAMSSIRGVPRRYDLAFHAACVSIALLYMYTNFKFSYEEIPEVNSKVSCIKKGLKNSLPDLFDKDYLLTTNGKTILSQLNNIYTIWGF